jgi:histidinol phosphatase-like enzyme (inositol monophosphatase family)
MNGTMMLDFAIKLADNAREMVLRAAQPQAETKPDRSFVTATDRAVEDMMRQMITDRFPDHGIMGEEGQDVAPGADHVWVLDPIDGTAAFVAGVPVHGTLIALAQDGVPVLGLIDMHVTGQRWVGAEGHPTRLLHQGRSNDCHTRKGQSLDRAMLSASNPDFFSAAERPALDALREATAWRVWGASCMAYGLLASGRIDLSLDTALAVHDWAPFAPIIEGAGGKVTDWQGRPLRLDSGPQVLAAGDPVLHDRALRLIHT